MGYRKKFEDSYLDEEPEEFDGNDTTDAERYIRLYQKNPRTGEENSKLEKLMERMFLQAKLPGIPGREAKDGLILIARKQKEIGMTADSVVLLSRLSDLASLIGDKDLYYQSMDEMSE